MTDGPDNRLSRAHVESGQTHIPARLDFLAQENMFHEQFAALVNELIAARQRELSPEQWQILARNLDQLYDAVYQFRMCLRELTES